jgi:membrane associated rhomboid family serine protease
MEVAPFSTGETEVVAQPVFVVENGALRPFAGAVSTEAPANAVEIRTQLDRDHEMALALSESNANENVRLTEEYESSGGRWDGQPMDIETNPVHRTVTNTERGFEPMEDHFDEIEYIASSRVRQLLTTSTCLVIGEFIMLVAMCGVEGFADTTENPLFGPPRKIFIRFQGKQASLMKYEHEWLRALFAIFLHAGFLHYVPIMIIQLRIGGYLNLIFGTPVFLAIYLISGVFGNLVACIAEPTSIGVGSQAALMGLLCAWICYIAFRWQHVNNNFDRFVNNRNRQIGIAAVCMLILLLVSFEPYVDIAGLFGGAIQV